MCCNTPFLVLQDSLRRGPLIKPAGQKRRQIRNTTEFHQAKTFLYQPRWPTLMESGDSSRRKEVAKDLDSYLDARHRGYQPRSSVRMTNETTVVEQEPAPVPQQETSEPVSKKRTWLSSVMEKVFKPEESSGVESKVVPNTSYAVPSADDTRQDMRDVATIALAVIKQLPERTLREFKESSDFDRFKTILRRHNIIK